MTVTSTGFPACTWSGIGTLPPGVTGTDNGDGSATISGTPAAGGVYLLRITATNVAGSDDQLLTLVVLQKPKITSADHTTCTVGTACAFTVRSTGVPTPRLLEKGAPPSGVTFTDKGNGRARLAGTPAADTGGTYKFTIIATSGVIPEATHGIRDGVPILPGATQSFTLTVVGPPAAPVASKPRAEERRCR